MYHRGFEVGGQDPWLVALVSAGQRPTDRCVVPSGAGRIGLWAVFSGGWGDLRKVRTSLAGLGGTSAGVQEMQPEDCCSGLSAGLRETGTEPPGHILLSHQPHCPCLGPRKQGTAQVPRPYVACIGLGRAKLSPTLPSQGIQLGVCSLILRVSFFQ